MKGDMTQPIWRPSSDRVAKANIAAFIAAVNARWQRSIADYKSLHAFSIDEPDKFWLSVFEFCNIRHEKIGERVVLHPEKMPGARWFPDARLNIARTLLAHDDAMSAVVALREDGVRREVTFGELRALTSRFEQAMRKAGVGIGDRVASYMPSIIETVAAMLATAAVGAIWAACPPEYGVIGAVDRLGQIEPKILFTADGYLHGGKRHPMLDRIGDIMSRVPSIETTVVVPVLDERPDIRAIGKAVSLDDFLAPFAPRDIQYESLPFEQPAYILFSSGTTGAPKCIIHSAGAALLENMKALTLQFDVKPGDRCYMACTTGWMVWNVMTIALGCGASIVLYDGSPFHGQKDLLVRHTADEKVTFVRLAARYVDALIKAGCEPARDYDLSAVKAIMCNGSPFSVEGYHYIHDKVKRDVHLVSPSGGTDSFGSLVSNNPISPVWPGEIQCPALGFSIEIYSPEGRALFGEPGELVVSKPFPSMPLGYRDDPDEKKYRDAYFNHFPGIWRHGDWAEITPRGGIVIHGRSDATLNAKGVRIGSADVYRALVNVPEVAESCLVAQDWDGDTRLVLFVQMQPGLVFDRALDERIRDLIRYELSPRHVPSKIVAVAEIPLTVTGKVSEAAVRDAIHGRPVRNRDALANPVSLAHFAPETLAESATPS